MIIRNLPEQNRRKSIQPQEEMVPPSKKPHKPQPNHTQKKFTCDHEGCNSSFDKRFTLTRHTRKHQKAEDLLAKGKGNFCKEPQCKNKFFADNSNFKRHMRAHAGEKPYMCYCGKKYADRSTFISHLMKEKDPLKHFRVTSESDNKNKLIAPLPALGLFEFDPNMFHHDLSFSSTVNDENPSSGRFTSTNEDKSSHSVLPSQISSLPLNNLNPTNIEYMQKIQEIKDTIQENYDKRIK